MAKVREIVGIALALMGWTTAILASVLPMWKISGDHNTDTTQIIWEGLWMHCAMKSTGHMECKAYDSMKAVGSDLKAARYMTIIAIIVALLSSAISFMGAECTKCIEDKKTLKAKLMIISGVFFMITGCLVLIPVSWTAYIILYLQNRHLGLALYVGFAAAALLITGGALLCCACTPQEESTTTSSTHQRIKTCAVVLGLIAWLLSVLVCILPVWKVTGGNTGVTGGNTGVTGVNTGVKKEVILEGLWITCVGQTTGDFQCTLNNSTLTLQLDLWAPQVMTVASIITTLLAFTVLIMSTNCCEDEALKAKSMIVSGVFFIISGVLVLIPVSQPSNIIIQNLCSPDSTSAEHRDLGVSWYLGFAAAAQSITVGVLLISLGCIRKNV